MLDYQRESPNIFHDIPSKYIPISPWCCWSNPPFGDSSRLHENMPASATWTAHWADRLSPGRDITNTNADICSMYGYTLFKGTMFQAISATAEYVQACFSHMCAHSSSSHTSHTGGYGHARLAHICAHTLQVTYLAISSTVAFLVQTRTTSSISMCCSFFHCDTHHETDFNLQIADTIRQRYRIGPLTFANRYGHVSGTLSKKKEGDE